MLGSSFEDVLNAARTGAEWAWTTLYRDLAPPVLGYFRSHGSPEPEDLTSEVFTSVVRNLSSFSGDEGNFRSWVFVIVHRRLMDDRRRLSRHPVAPAPDAWLDGPAGDVEAEALTQLGIDRVRKVFAHLSPDQRDVLLLRVVADLSIEQIATIVGKRTGAVKALQRRGLEAVAKIVSEEAVPL